MVFLCSSSGGTSHFNFTFDIQGLQNSSNTYSTYLTIGLLTGMHLHSKGEAVPFHLSSLLCCGWSSKEVPAEWGSGEGCLYAGGLPYLTPTPTQNCHPVLPRHSTYQPKLITLVKPLVCPCQFHVEQVKWACDSAAPTCQLCCLVLDRLDRLVMSLSTKVFAIR